ncbi:sodium/calcium exchanger NCL2-like protein [Tanacetum coccineum]|uniref:Sodium/calcium exchanger NCL2-like protein n=1 Tax=Tanacetum coccineum TaxID=301880 RepID=A0ABQ5ATQ4_9ASTR
MSGGGCYKDNQEHKPPTTGDANNNHNQITCLKCNSPEATIFTGGGGGGRFCEDCFRNNLYGNFKLVVTSNAMISPLDKVLVAFSGGASLSSGGSGVLTHPETCYHAKVMFYSLIMFVVILLPSVYGVSYASQEYGIALVSVSASLICLFCYFCHKKRLEYAEVEQKVEVHVPFYDVQALMLDREKHLMIKQKELE